MITQKLAEIYDIIEGAVDDAIVRQKFNLRLYDYLRANKFTKDELNQLLNSSPVNTIKTTSADLREYIEGGSDNEHKQLREAYGYLSKPLARKLKIYIDGIVEDVIKYKNTKGKGKKNQKN